MVAARLKAAHSNHFRYVYVFFALMYIASETCNVNVNRSATKGMKIDYVSVNLFEVLWHASRPTCCSSNIFKQCEIL